MDIIFTGGSIVSDGLEIQADLAIRDGAVAAIGKLDELEAKERIDCTGKLILPGAVDLGLNPLDDGSCDPATKEEFSKTTEKAVEGGVTTIITAVDLPENETAVDGLLRHRAERESGAAVDFGFHLFLKDWSSARARQVKEAASVGCPSIWIGRADTNQSLPSPVLIHAVMRQLSDDTLAITRPYDAAFDLYLRKHMTNGTMDEVMPEWLEKSFFNSLPSIMENCQGRLLVAGISSRAAVEAFMAARDANGRVLAAATLPHLFLDSSSGELPSVWPPIRTRNDQQAIYSAIEEGVITAVVSSHKPRTVNQTFAGDKQAERNVGMSTLHHFLPLLISEGINKFRLMATTVSLAACADPAKLAGLYPKKGSLQVGSDADIVLVDPVQVKDAEWEEDTSPMEFFNLFRTESWQGVIEGVWLRGARIATDGKVTDKGSGHFLERRMALK